jgi:hypothetical protein
LPEVPRRGSQRLRADHIVGLLKALRAVADVGDWPRRRRGLRRRIEASATTGPGSSSTASHHVAHCTYTRGSPATSLATSRPGCRGRSGKRLCTPKAARRSPPRSRRAVPRRSALPPVAPPLFLLPGDEADRMKATVGIARTSRCAAMCLAVCVASFAIFAGASPITAEASVRSCSLVVDSPPLVTILSVRNMSCRGWRATIAGDGRT